MWRECIKKIWEVDPLTCPKCTGDMKIISFIYQRQVIRKILEYFKIYGDEPQRPPPKKMILIREVEIEPFYDSWPGYEETVFEM
jgi:hypothetical protein